MTEQQKPIDSQPAPASRWSEIWEAITHAGLAEITIRLGSHVLLVALILVVAWGLREFYLYAQVIGESGGALAAAPLPSPTPTESAPILPQYSSQSGSASSVSRQTHLHTDVPPGHAPACSYTRFNPVTHSSGLQRSSA